MVVRFIAPQLCGAEPDEDKTLPLLNEFVAGAGPVHLPSGRLPARESDTKAHNGYKAKVRACGRAARARVLTRWERR